MSTPARTRAPQLTARHVDMLRRSANGQTSAEIARDLFLSLDTINDTWRQIYQRIGARNRANAVAIAVVRGLVRPDEVDLRPPRDSAA